MKKAIINFMPLLLIIWLCILQSCQTVSHNYGQSFIPFKKDSIATLEFKKSLNGLDDHDFLYRSFSTKVNQTIPYRLLTPYKTISSQQPFLEKIYLSGYLQKNENRGYLENLICFPASFVIIHLLYCRSHTI